MLWEDRTIINIAGPPDSSVFLKEKNIICRDAPDTSLSDSILHRVLSRCIATGKTVTVSVICEQMQLEPSATQLSVGRFFARQAGAEKQSATQRHSGINLCPIYWPLSWLDCYHKRFSIKILEQLEISRSGYFRIYLNAIIIPRQTLTLLFK